jgi:tetratricopeptide (TPR) repeat protein
MERTPEGTLVDETLRAAGWIDVLEGYARTGIEVSGLGEVALQYPNDARKTLLRLEHHAKGPDGVPELHFHVTDERDVGPDLVLRPRQNLREVLDTIVALQGDITLANLNDGPISRLLDVCPETYFALNGRLRTIRPSPEVAVIFEEAVRLANAEDFAAAAEKLERALALCPDHDRAAGALAEVARALEDYPRMLRAADVWCDLTPDETEPHCLRSIALQNLRRFDEALVAIDEAIAIDDADARLHWQRACVLALAGRPDESIGAIETVLACDPEVRSDIAEDDDFASLRAMPAFQKLVR